MILPGNQEFDPVLKLYSEKMHFTRKFYMCWKFFFDRKKSFLVVLTDKIFFLQLSLSNHAQKFDLMILVLKDNHLILSC